MPRQLLSLVLTFGSVCRWVEGGSTPGHLLMGGGVFRKKSQVHPSSKSVGGRPIAQADGKRKPGMCYKGPGYVGKIRRTKRGRSSLPGLNA